MGRSPATPVIESSGAIDFPEGGVTLLVGNNGGGKSTFLQTICGILPALEGGDGIDGAAVYLPEELNFPPTLKGRQLMSALFRSPDSATEALLLLGVPLDTAFGKLSKGNRQKVRIVVTEAFGALKRADLICHDEPMSGLDLITRKLLAGIWGGTREGPIVFSKRAHRIIAMHAGVPPRHQRVLVAVGGKLRVIPPIAICDSWMEATVSSGVDPKEMIS